MVTWLSKKYEKIFSILLILLSIHMIIYILVGSKNLMNSDSAFIVDYSLEQIKNKTFFLTSWFHTNDFWHYSLIPLVTIFVKMGLNLFLSRQLSVLIQSILIFLIIFDIFKKYFKNLSGFKIVALLFLSGISGQFLFEVFGDATYGSIIFYMLLSIWLLIRYLTYKKIINAIFLGITLLLLTALSLRFPIFIGMPIICVLLYFCYENGIKKEYIIVLVTIILSIGIGYLLYRKLLENYTLLSTVIKDLISHEEPLAKSLDRIVFDYLSLSGATGLNAISLGISYNVNNIIKSTSPLVIISFIKFIYAIITILLPFILLKKIKIMTENEKVIYIFSFSLLIIIFFFLYICNMSDWYRYIIPILFFLNLLYPLLYKYNFSSKRKDKVVFALFISLVSISSLILSTNAYYDFETHKFKENIYESLAEFLVSKDLHFGYTSSWPERNLYTLLTNGKLRVLSLSSDGKQPYYWLNSEDWYERDYYNGKVFYMRKTYFDSIDLESKAIDVYTHEDNIIFVFESNDVIVDNYIINN